MIWQAGRKFSRAAVLLLHVEASELSKHVWLGVPAVSPVTVSGGPGEFPRGKVGLAKSRGCAALRVGV
jgi:hypothetical protein